MKYFITKIEIKRILTNAELTYGEFISGSKADVIGHIARHLMKLDSPSEYQLDNLCVSLTQGEAMGKNPHKMLERGNLFGALSALFENAVFKNGNVVNFDVRFECLQFVDRHFPDRIELNKQGS